MGHLKEVTDKTAFEGLPSAFECTIRVEPYLDEPDYTDPDPPPYEYTCMGIRFFCGKDEPSERTLFIHKGPREGPEWEKSKAILRVLMRYIQDHIGQVMIEGVSQLEDESRYISVPGKELKKKVFDKSPAIAQLHKHFGSRHKAAVRYKTEFDMWVYTFAAHVKNRLEGFAHMKIGDDSILRFSRYDMKLFMDVLPDCQKIWQRAREILRNDPERGTTDKWKERAKSELEIKSYDEDLLDAIAKWNYGRRDYEYKPTQVAHVHAARRATVNTREKHFSRPTADQYKTVERLKKEWERRTAEAQELGFRLDTFWFDP